MHLHLKNDKSIFTTIVISQIKSHLFCGHVKIQLST